MSKIDDIDKKIEKLKLEKKRLIEILDDAPTLLPYINTLLKLVGYSAQLNSNNIGYMNIYDIKTGKKHARAKITNPIEFKFIDNNGEEISIESTNLTVANTHMITKGCEICLFHDSKDFEVYKIEKGNDFYLESLFLNDNYISASVNNIAYNDYIKDGEERRICYRKDKNYLGSLMIERNIVSTDYKCLGINDNEIVSINYSAGKGNTIYAKFDNEDELDNAVLQISVHPRNKELIEYVINDFDRELTGLKDYIQNKYEVYNKIMQTEYTNNSVINLLVERTIDESCNLSNMINKQRLLK